MKRGRAQVAITEMSQSDGSLIKAWSALLMRRNSLTSLRCTVFCVRLHKPENSNVTKTVSGMFKVSGMFNQFYVCLNSTVTAYLSDMYGIFCVFIKNETRVHYLYKYFNLQTGLDSAATLLLFSKKIVIKN